MEILNVIPEIFYDIIGRTVPGMVAIWVWSLAFDETLGHVLVAPYRGAPALSGSAPVLVGTFIFAGYLVGHLLSAASGFSHTYVLARIFPGYFSVLKNACDASDSRGYPTQQREFFRAETEKALKGSPTSAQYRQLTYLWYDSARAGSAEMTAKLGKMRAEYRMLEGLYVGLFLAIPLSIGKWIFGGPVPSYVLLSWVTVGVVISAWSAARTYRTFQRAVINQYYLLRTKISTVSGTDGARKSDINTS
jgi:hypothetical protein